MDISKTKSVEFTVLPVLSQLVFVYIQAGNTVYSIHTPVLR